MDSTIKLGSQSILSRVLWGWFFALIATVFSVIFYGFLVMYELPSAALVIFNLMLALALYGFWRAQNWGEARYDGFAPALLIFMMVFKGFAALDFMLFGIRADVWPDMLPMTISYEWIVLQGELITQAGVLLMAGAWRLFMGPVVGNTGFMDKAFSMPASTLWFLYGLAFFTRLATKILGADFGPLGSLFSILFSFGIAAIFLIGARQKSGVSKVVVSAALGLPLMLFSLAAGMKEELIMPLIPAGVHFLKLNRGALYKSGVAAIAVLVLALSQSFVSIVRETAWANNEADVNLSEISSIYLDRFNSQYVSDSVKTVFTRINMTNVHAVTVAVSHSNGFYFGEIIAGIPIALIPRVIWPSKPAIMPGAQHTKRIWGAFIDEADVSTATSAGFFTELYLGGGIIILILGSIAFAFLNAWLFRYLYSRKHHVACCLFSYTYFIAALRFDELHVVYAFNGIILFFLTVYGAEYIAKFYENSIKRN